MKLQTAILHDNVVAQTDWAVAKTLFPIACDEQFVERWAISLVHEQAKARSALPDAFFVELDRRISADKSSAASRVSDVVHLCPLILMLYDSS